MTFVKTYGSWGQAAIALRIAGKNCQPRRFTSRLVLCRDGFLDRVEGRLEHRRHVDRAERVLFPERGDRFIFLHFSLQAIDRGDRLLPGLFPLAVVDRLDMIERARCKLVSKCASLSFT